MFYKNVLSPRSSALNAFLQKADLKIFFLFFSTAKKSHRISDGETIINSHAVVIARRSLMVFLYRQLLRLFEGRFSIFEYNDKEDGKIARLRPQYKIHLYMKSPPCGDASINIPSHSKLDASTHE